MMWEGVNYMTTTYEDNGMEELGSIWRIPIGGLENSDISGLNFMYLVGMVHEECDDYVPMMPLIVVNELTGTISDDGEIWEHCITSKDWRYDGYIAKLVSYENSPHSGPLVKAIGEMRDCDTIFHWMLRKALDPTMVVCDSLANRPRFDVYLIPSHINTNHKELTMYVKNVINYSCEATMIDMLLFSRTDILHFIQTTPIDDIKRILNNDSHTVIVTTNHTAC